MSLTNINRDILILGYVAVFIGSIAPISQLYQVIKTKKVRDLSPFFFVLRVLSEILYVLYGFLITDYVMVASATIPAILESIIFIYWCVYRNKPET